MRKNIYRYIFTVLCLFLFSDTHSEIKAIIFDFGGVLGRTSESKFAYEIGLKDLAALGLKDLFLLDFSHLGLKEKVLEIMSEFGVQNRADNGLMAKHGQVDLPEIMCKWLRGEISGEEANKIVQTYLDNLSQYPDKFKNETEKKVLSSIVRIMFDSQKLAEFTLPIKESLNILSELKGCKDEAQQDKYKFLMLSNWATEPFKIIYQSQNQDMQDVFKFFDPTDIFISGDMKVMKPSNLAYQNILDHIKTKYNILPEECLMIDDQPENIVAATRYCKMQGLLVTKNCNNLRSELVKLNILKEKHQNWISNLVPFSWS